MKKILFISTGLATGGAETMLYKLLLNMDRKQFDPAVVSLIGEGAFSQPIRDLDIPVYELELRGGSILKSLQGLFKIIRQEQPDILQGWMYHGNIFAQLGRVLLFKPTSVIWNIRHSLYSLDYEKSGTAQIIRVLGKLSGLASKIIYNSEIGAKQHQEKGYAAQKTIVIPNGFDPQLFKASPENYLSVRQELNLAADIKLVGRICRYHPMKGHEYFLQAAGELAKDFPDLHFLLVGTNVDLENPALKNLIEELGIGDRVHLLGERKDTARLTSACDVSVSSSYFGEAFPNIIGEAMACEVPCVVTDVGDSALIVGDTGKVVPSKDSSAIAQGCRELLLMDSQAKEELGKKARQKVVDMYSIKAVVDQYETLYATV